MIEDAGFTYDPPDVLPNAMHSLELGELARDAGVFRELHGRLFTAYWSRHLDIGDPAVLENIAVAGGLDAGKVRETEGTRSASASRLRQPWAWVWVGFPLG